MSDETESEEAAGQRRALRFVGYGIMVAGVIAVGATAVSTDPGPLVVYGLLGLGVAVFLLEVVEGGASGVSVGLLLGSLGGWLWPRLGEGSYTVLGGTLVVVGVVNAVVSPYFHALGKRLAER